MDSEQNTGPKYAFGDDRLTLEDAVAISDELLSRPTALQDAEAFFARLQISSPFLFRMIADAAQELSTMPGARYLRFPSSPNHADANSTASQTSFDSVMDPIIVTDAYGTLWYQCTHSGKQYARQGRARDSRNATFNIKPYKCTGRCGDTSWLYEIIRHQGAPTSPPEGRKGQLLELRRIRLEAESLEAREILHEGRVREVVFQLVRSDVLSPIHLVVAL